MCIRFPKEGGATSNSYAVAKISTMPLAVNTSCLCNLFGGIIWQELVCVDQGWLVVGDKLSCFRIPFPSFFSECDVTRGNHSVVQRESPYQSVESELPQRLERISRSLVTPVFLFHVGWITVLTSVAVVTTLHVLLQIVFVCCTFGIHYATSLQAGTTRTMYACNIALHEVKPYVLLGILPV
jgi:hypothetical protein